MKLSRSGGTGPWAGLALVALLVSNLVTNRWLSGPAYVTWNLGLASVLTALARAAGHSNEEIGLGFHPVGLEKGARTGFVGATAVSLAYAALLRSGRAGSLLSDRRLTDISRGKALWRFFVEIPLGTALTEEVAFRGVLPLLFRSNRMPAWAPAILTSALFGLWHLLPAIDDARANRRPVIRSMAVTATATGLAGGVLHHLRASTGHLVAPVAIHSAANGLGLLAVRMAARGR